MKKFLFLGAMAAMLLGTASCSNDMEPAMGGEVPVSFAIDLGDNIDSRTISDGLKANTLKFAVFENDTEITALAQTVAVANKQATINTKLVKGHTYKFVFWAQNSACTAYNTSDMSAIKVNYEEVNCNDETRDAFYKMDSFTVTEAFEKTEVLTRPFAQINFLADDAAGVVGVDTYKSMVTVTGVPTTLNTLNGSVSGSTDVTFALATIPNETLADYEDYKYVAMNYILAATEKEVKNEVVLTVNDGTADVNTVTVANCPVQRNYRTNIFGSLFTLNGKFNIEIDPIYAGNHEVDLDATIFNVTSETELTTAMNSGAKKIVINLMNDVELSFGARTVYGNENTVSITIDGNGHTLDMYGTNTDWSSISTAGNSTFIIKNATVNYTSANPSTTWNGHDLNIGKDKSSPASGKFIAKNVIFNTAISFGLDAELEDVTIQDKLQDKAIYAMWVQATVANLSLKNCNIIQRGGRAIKVDSQYKNDDELVLTNITVDGCKFVSNQKSAILIKNKMGANIVASNYDITEVNADSENLVWNDSANSAYYDLITVTGCTKKQEE